MFCLVFLSQQDSFRTYFPFFSQIFNSQNVAFKLPCPLAVVLQRQTEVASQLKIKKLLYQRCQTLKWAIFLPKLVDIFVKLKNEWSNTFNSFRELQYSDPISCCFQNVCVEDFYRHLPPHPQRTYITQLPNHIRSNKCPLQMQVFAKHS